MSFNQTFFYFLILLLAFSPESSVAASKRPNGPTLRTHYQQKSYKAPPDFPLLQMSTESAGFGLSVFGGDTGGFDLIGSGDRMVFAAPVIFPRKIIELPRDFGSATGGLTFSRSTGVHDHIGLSLIYGYSGTQIFRPGYVPIAEGDLVIETSFNSGNSLIIHFNYSNSRPFLNGIPIPGLAFSLNGDNYRLVLGIPFLSLDWSPDPLRFSVSASPFSGAASMGLKIYGPLSVFGSALWSPRAFQNLIPDNTEVFIYDSKELSYGVRLGLSPTLSLLASSIHSFGRRLIFGKSMFDEDSESISIGDSEAYLTSLHLNF